MSRRIVLWVGVAALTVVCVSILILVRVGASPEPQPTPTQAPTTPPSTSQNTLFIALRSSGGAIADAVTLGTPAKQGSTSSSWLSVQPGLAVGVEPDGQVTLARVEATAAEQTGRIVANQLGIVVDDVLIVDRLAFAALVDSVNGVTVRVERPVWVVLPDGQMKIVARPGVQTLEGPAAADYAIALLPGELQASRTARFDEVLRQVIVKLPVDPDRTRDAIATLGSSSQTSGSVSQMAQTLLAVRTSILDNNIANAAVPATRAQVDDQTVYTLIPASTLAVMRDLFQPSLLLPTTPDLPPRVRLFAAGVDDAAAAAASDLLSEAGQSMVWGGVVDPAKRSEIYVSAARFQSVGNETAVALGLPVSVVRVDATRSIGVPVTVILGTDTKLYTPSPSPSSTSS